MSVGYFKLQESDYRNEIIENLSSISEIRQIIPPTILQATAISSLTNSHSANADPRIRPPITLPPIPNINPACIASTTIVIFQLIRRIPLIGAARV